MQTTNKVVGYFEQKESWKMDWVSFDMTHSEILWEIFSMRSIFSFQNVEPIKPYLGFKAFVFVGSNVVQWRKLDKCDLESRSRFFGCLNVFGILIKTRGQRLFEH